MNMRDLIPWGRTERSSSVPSVRGEEVSPFLTLHREMNRLFDDVFSRFESGMPSLLGRSTAVAWPSMEVVETDKDLRVTAELAGLDEKDIDVLLDDGVLTIRGEKRAEHEDEGRRFSERFYGQFMRQLPVGEVEEDKIEASFKDGVLTVTLPKSAKAQEKAKRIAINSKAKDTKH